MKTYGKQIAFYRKRTGITQAKLGNMLNVSAQAVSKWENGLSEPDIATLQRMAQIFGVSVDELLAETEPSDVDEAEADAAPEEASKQEEPKNQPQVVQPPEPKIIVGYCDDCKKPVYKGDNYNVSRFGRGMTGQTLRCESCHKKHNENMKRIEHSELLSSRNKGLIVGGIVSGVLFMISLIYTFSQKQYADLWAVFVGAYVIFAFVSQLFWGEFLRNFIGFFWKSLKFPGLIFSLDLDGIIWFICVKLLFAIIGFVFTALFFLLGLVLALFVSAFSFPFALVKLQRQLKA